MLDLSNVTLFSLSWGNKIESTTKAIIHCAKLCKFYDIVFLTPPSVSENPIENEIRYNQFMISHLYKKIESDFCLVIQWDGFVINPEMWNDDFMNYDYIGAPWNFKGSRNNVGNGGFSLRSKKFLEASSRISYHPTKCDWFDKQQAVDRPISPEDWFLCYHSYDEMLNNDIKFAPVNLASEFSVENPGCNVQFNRDDISTYGSFGFHYSANTAAMNLLEKQSETV